MLSFFLHILDAANLSIINLPTKPLLSAYNLPGITFPQDSRMWQEMLKKLCLPFFKKFMISDIKALDGCRCHAPATDELQTKSFALSAWNTKETTIKCIALPRLYSNLRCRV
jgi:hypothetical protein